MLTGSILLVADDDDELDFIKQAAAELQIERPVEYFRNGNELINYLRATPNSPFLIICDLKLPGESAFELKERMNNDEELNYKTVPFIFWSNSASETEIQKAYDLPAQGFFPKPDKFRELCETFETILKYWSKSRHPKDVA